MKKRFLLGTALVAVTALGVVSACLTASNHEDAAIKAGAVTYVSALDNGNGLSNADYAMKQTKQADFAKFNYFLAKQSEEGHAVLAPHGFIYNYDSSNEMGAIHGLECIHVKYSSTGKLYLRIMLDDDGKYDYGKLIEIPNDEDLEIRGFQPNYVRIEAGDSQVDIESIEFEYTCSSRFAMSDRRMVSGVYTGIYNDLAYKLTLNDNGTALFATMNKAGAQDTYSASTWFNYYTKVSITFDGPYDIELIPGDGYTSLSVNPEVGIGAMFSGMKLTKVMNVEDFESYTATGVGLDQSHNIYSTTGLRSQFHSDYNAKVVGKTSLFGDENWSFMGSSDYLTLSTNTGVGGSKCALFKSSSTGLRYVTMNSFVESTRRLGKGSKFSFWAHGAVNGSGTSNGADMSLKVRIFYKNGIDACSDSTGVATTVTIPAGSDWTQYEIALDTSKEFYGYSFFLKNNTAGYLPIDNIQMYDVNPNTVYVAPKAATIDGTYTVTASISAIQANYGVVMALDNTGKATVLVGGADAGATSYTYNSITHEVSVPTTGSVPTYGFTYGTITGTLNEATGELEDVGFDGTASSYITNNGHLVATRPATCFDCEGTTGDLLNTFRRRYDNGGGWGFDTNNNDRIVANTNAATGESSLKFRCLGDGNVSHKTALTLVNELSLTDVKNISAYVLNDTGVEFTIRVFIYKATNFGSNSEIKNWTIPADSTWHFYQAGFNLSGGTLYNFQFFVGVPEGRTTNFYPSFDDICIW